MRFIFEVKVIPPYTVEEYAANWVRASEIIQRTPGALGTRLHRKIGAPDTLLAIAHWSSKEARDARDDSRDKLVGDILAMHRQTCQITVIGEFEEAEWEVSPGTATK